MTTTTPEGVFCICSIVFRFIFFSDYILQEYLDKCVLGVACWFDLFSLCVVLVQ